MAILKGVIHDGQVVLTQPTDLPEGTEVQIVPIDLAVSADDERHVTSDEIAQTLAAMERPALRYDRPGAGRDQGRSPCPQGTGEIPLLQECRPAPRDVGMRRFVLDTAIAGDDISRRRGDFELPRDEVARGKRIGITLTVLAELVHNREIPSRSNDPRREETSNAHEAREEG